MRCTIASHEHRMNLRVVDLGDGVSCGDRKIAEVLDVSRQSMLTSIFLSPLDKELLDSPVPFVTDPIAEVLDIFLAHFTKKNAILRSC